MLAYYVTFELAAAPDAPCCSQTTRHSLPPTPSRPRGAQKPPRPRPAAPSTADGHPASNLPDLLADLATIARNEIRIGQAEHTFTRLTKPTPLQARALELLDVKLAA